MRMKDVLSTVPYAKVAMPYNSVSVKAKLIFVEGRERRKWCTSRTLTFSKVFYSFLECVTPPNIVCSK